MRLRGVAIRGDDMHVDAKARAASRAARARRAPRPARSRQEAMRTTLPGARGVFAAAARSRGNIGVGNALARQRDAGHEGFARNAPPDTPTATDCSCTGGRTLGEIDGAASADSACVRSADRARFHAADSTWPMPRMRTP